MNVLFSLCKQLNKTDHIQLFVTSQVNHLLAFIFHRLILSQRVNKYHNISKKYSRENTGLFSGFSFLTNTSFSQHKPLKQGKELSLN